MSPIILLFVYSPAVVGLVVGADEGLEVVGLDDGAETHNRRDGQGKQFEGIQRMI